MSFTLRVAVGLVAGLLLGVAISASHSGANPPARFPRDARKISRLGDRALGFMLSAPTTAAMPFLISISDGATLVQRERYGEAMLMRV